MAIRDPRLLEALAQQYGGTAALPQIQRSQYLADALKALQESAQGNIKNVGALGANLGGELLLALGQRRSDRNLSDTVSQGQRLAAGMNPDSAVFGSPQDAAPSPMAAPEMGPAAFPAQSGISGAAPALPSAQAAPQRLAGALSGNPPPPPSPPLDAIRTDPAKFFSGILGAPATITSGQRSPAHNRAVGGSPTSEHLTNSAWDIQVPGMAPARVAQMLSGANLGFDQVIDEGNHVHIGFGPKGRGEMLRLSGGRYTPMAGAAPPPAPQAAPPPPPAPPPQQMPQQPPQAPQAPQQGLAPLYGQYANERERAYLQAAQNAPPGSQAWQQAQQMREQIAARAREQRPYDVQIVNGVPVAIDKLTGKMSPLGVPQEAMSHTMSAGQAGINAPPGTSANVDPTGNARIVYQPQAGQQAVNQPGEPYRETQIPGGSGDPRSGQNIVANESQLRQQYDREIANYRIAREGYQKVLQAASTRTPAGDIALVFGYMKTLDPPSSVREGEQATVRNSGTIPQTIINVYNSLLTGKGSLTDQQRQQFAEAASRQYAAYETTAQAMNKRYGDIARSYGFDPSRVVQTFDPVNQMAAPPSTQIPVAAGSPNPAINQGQVPTSGNTAAGGRRLSVEEAAKLPRGTHFVGMDGIDRVRQ